MAYEDGNNSAKASFGVRSTSEDNFGFEGKGGYERKAALSTKSGSGFKMQLGFYWKHADKSLKKSIGDHFTAKITTYEKVGIGPVSIESSTDGTDELSITLGKKALKSTTPSGENGGKAVGEFKFKTNMYNLK